MKITFIIFIGILLGCNGSNSESNLCSMKNIELNNYINISRSDWSEYDEYLKIIEIEHYDSNYFDLRLRKVRKFQSVNAVQMIFDSIETGHTKYSYIICLDSGKIISATVINKALSDINLILGSPAGSSL